jgi:hypothetical protein
MDEFHPMIYLFNPTKMTFIHAKMTFIHAGGLKSHQTSKYKLMLYTHA